MYEYKLYVCAYFSMHARLCISSLSNLPHTIKKRSHTYNALTIIQSGIWFVIHYMLSIRLYTCRVKLCTFTVEVFFFDILLDVVGRKFTLFLHFLYSKV